MLNDAQILKQRDHLGALDVAAKLHAQISREIPVINEDHDGRELRHVIVAGMGGSALAADAAKVLYAIRYQFTPRSTSASSPRSSGPRSSSG